MQQNDPRPQHFADITQDMIQDWKARHGAENIRQIDIPGETQITAQGNTVETVAASFVARRPSRSVMDIIAEKGAKNDIVGVNKTLTANCLLGGDLEAMEQDGTIYTAVLEALTQMMGERKASIKKL